MTINDDGTLLGILLLINNLLPFILFFIGCSILYFSAESFIDNSINLSKKLNISPIIIGASVIAIGTSLPELLVSLFSIFKHNTSNDIGNLVSSSIVIGNILGSNIANIALVMGFCAVIHNIVLNINILKDLLFITLLGFYVLVCVYYEIPINYIHGILLLLSFIAYFYYLIKNNSNNENGFLNLKKSPVSIKSEWRPYLADIAFQTYVTSQAFPEWSITPYLMLVNKSKETNMDGLNQLFTIVQTEENGEMRLGVEVNEKEINASKEKIKDTVLQDVNVKRVVNSILYDTSLGNDNFFDLLNRPLSEFGTENASTFIEAAHQLSDAYKNEISLDKSGSSFGACCSKCTFCYQEIIPNYNPEEKYISSIWKFPKNKIPELFEQKVFSIKDLRNNPGLNPLNPNTKSYFRQSLQIDLTANNDLSEWHSDDISEVMSEWNFPLHFIDFETCTVPLPFHKNEYPYAIIASQFSIHTLQENGNIKHYQWLADQSPIDPTIQFVKELKKILSNDNGKVFMYANHENAVLKSAKQRMLPNRNEFKDEIDFISS